MNIEERKEKKAFKKRKNKSLDPTISVEIYCFVG